MNTCHERVMVRTGYSSLSDTLQDDDDAFKWTLRHHLYRAEWGQQDITDSLLVCRELCVSVHVHALA